MDLPKLYAVEEQAMDIVLQTLNKATIRVGRRLNLCQLASSPSMWGQQRVTLKSVHIPIGITAERVIINAIEVIWKLTRHFSYHIQYKGVFIDNWSEYYHYEVIFSQPTAEFPIPQETVSVFFTVKVKLTEISFEPSLMTFRVEGQHLDHNIDNEILTPESILAVLQFKRRFFRCITALHSF